MDLVTLVAAFGASKKYTDSLGSGITNIQVSPDGTSLIFTTTNGSTFTISVEDWNAITLAEKEKIDKVVISGDGDLFLSNDGVYKLPSGGNSNYNMLSNKPSINGNQLLGDKNGTDLGFSTVATTGSYNDLSNKPSIPTLTSQLSNDSGFVISTVNNLINYYLKSDTYTKTEVNGLIGNIASIDVQIVTTLPTQNISLTTIYLIQIPETTNYNQWMYINSSWANIGSTTVDLTNYYTKTEIDTLLNGKVDKITGYGLSQENYTTAEKTKLAGLNNYTPPIATETTLGQVMVDGISIFVDENGVISAATGGGGLPPNNVSGFSITSGIGSLTVKWSDPANIVVEGQTLSTWKGTKLLYKKTGYPVSPSDGVLAVDNQVRDTYSVTGFTINGLTNGLYYIKLFPYSDTYAYNISEANQNTGDLSGYKIMTAIIDTTNSNPLTSVTYADDALTMIPGSAEWDTWFGYYPCLFNAGSEVGKLNPNNFGQFADGSSADIISGSAGDVMIAFPRMGLKIETIGTNIYIKMTDNPNDENFEYNAHTRGTESRSLFYLGTYKGSLIDTKLRSLSNQTIGINNSMEDFRIFAHNNGDGYELSGFYQLVFRQAMYVLKYKDLNSQSVIGMGFVNASNASPHITGGTNTSGMTWGSQNSTEQMKLFGLEDFYGNIYEFIDGFILDSSRNILTATTNFNNSGTGYENLGIISSENISASYLTNVHGTTKKGFLPKTASGSATTYYCDQGTTAPSSVFAFGGYYSVYTRAGVFYQYIQFSGVANNLSGSRLMFL